MNQETESPSNSYLQQGIWADLEEIISLIEGKEKELKNKIKEGVSNEITELIQDNQFEKSSAMMHHLEKLLGSIQFSADFEHIKTHIQDYKRAVDLQERSTHELQKVQSPNEEKDKKRSYSTTIGWENKVKSKGFSEGGFAGVTPYLIKEGDRYFFSEIAEGLPQEEFNKMADLLLNLKNIIFVIHDTEEEYVRSMLQEWLDLVPGNKRKYLYIQFFLSSSQEFTTEVHEK